MAAMMMQRKAFGLTRQSPRTTRVVRAQAASRELWFPGNPPPAHLDGTLPGDFGFDPLYLAAEEETRRWMVQAELIHCRWAMLGAAGIMLTSIGNKVGLGFPEWYEAGKVVVEKNNIDFGTLVVTMHLLMGWVEMKRWYDYFAPGSQGDGSFLGFTTELKGTENGYPGGPWFDFLGLARGSPAMYERYKWSEIRNGRLAMIANLGFAAQYAATGKGPMDNLAAHLADPNHVNFATNGISVPLA
ncbi:hypothetical protein HYH03_007518 [Edaphochlamys debaryana]|uniref:Chlorophyll a-b binding protein, chloroplastic n=1 Tax=Edaphochlamys debaryana TaxID=47281 RepID=A0A835Y5D2_9CHLO|nr:hypothetical protein HYH03_007518 [Edaphochlamys debaryana]|eukprot:KAG2494466.1 hypothetical protein HYH03_007518 [Edaphochlamys debaryana]